MPLSNDEVLRLIDDYVHGLLDDDAAEEVCASLPDGA